MSKSARLVLFGTVFLTGAAVLIFEVAAVRLLSPYFGSSIYVISSVLTTILAALSLGYYWGGRLADKNPRVSVLYSIIGLSGLIMNFLFLYALNVLPSSSQLLPTTIGPLIFSLMFFLAPAFLLGIDSPFVIKLLTSQDNHEHNGALVGSTFFWSTIGSIVGSLISGFYLIPFLGVRLTFVGTAVLLSLLALVALWVLRNQVNPPLSKKEYLVVIGIALVSIFIAGMSLTQPPATNNPGTLLFARDGYYSHIEVRELTTERGDTVRTLHRETNNSSRVVLGTTTFAFAYNEFGRAHRYLQSDTENYLLLGGGAYSLPRTLLAEEPDLNFDVVEIEPVLYDIALKYFDLTTTSRLQNYPIDARSFLNQTDKTYDVIFADAFQSGHFIPAHLATQEFFTDIRSHLTTDGIFIANIIGALGQDKVSLTGSLVKTMQSVFPNLSLYQVQDYKHGLNNIMIIARADNSPVIFPDEFIIDMKDGTFVRANDRLRSIESARLEKQIIFTDDKAPVEPLLAQQIFDYLR